MHWVALNEAENPVHAKIVIVRKKAAWKKLYSDLRVLR
jgi:hypothetical protein